jgi:predicted phage terminase large subunit-like protein
VEAGNVTLVEGSWMSDFFDEAETFPAGRFKDQIDAATRAFEMLALPKKAPAVGIPRRHR